jgi:hypothetical protein
MHFQSHNQRTTVCGVPLSSPRYVRTKRGGRMVPVRTTPDRERVRCRACRDILKVYEAAYGPYTAEAQ